MAVRNKMVPLMLTHNGVAPEFHADEDWLRVTLRRGKGNRG